MSDPFSATSLAAPPSFLVSFFLFSSCFLAERPVRLFATMFFPDVRLSTPPCRGLSNIWIVAAPFETISFLARLVDGFSSLGRRPKDPAFVDLPSDSPFFFFFLFFPLFFVFFSLPSVFLAFFCLRISGAPGFCVRDVRFSRIPSLTL